ncbi:MAG: AraC family transcriptional regulator [Puniceicoccales bacterium]
MLENLSIELSPNVSSSRYSGPPPNVGGRRGVLLAGFEVCTQDYQISRQSFPYWTLEFIVAGNGHYHWKSGESPIGPGAIFCYGPNQFHRFRNVSDQSLEKYFIVRRDLQFPREWKQAGLGEVPMCLRSIVEARQVMENMLQECEVFDSHALTIANALESQLLALAQRHSQPMQRADSPSRRAYDLALGIVIEEFRTLPSLEALALRSGYSKAYLCRLFRDYRGDTPYQVLLQYKMRHAWLLLRGGKLRVKSVAQEVGFTDPLHFSRVFRKVIGCSPSEVMGV